MPRLLSLTLAAPLCLLACSGTSKDMTTPAAGDAQPVTPSRGEIGDEVFSASAMLEYRVTIAPATWAEMQEKGDDEEYREVAVQVDGLEETVSLSSAGLRFKGDYSLHHCFDDGGSRKTTGDCAKLNMKLKFSEFDADGRLDGLKRLNLHAMAADPTLLRERIAYKMFSDFGVVAPRAAYARLIINDEAPLLVLAVEQVDGRFTARHFDGDGQGDGNLYKEVWPSASLVDYEEEVLQALKTNNNAEDSPDVSKMLEFGTAVGSSSAQSFAEDLGDDLHVDQLLRYLAVDRAIKNWDGITAFYAPDFPHNFYWYQDAGGSERFVLIPWDLDKTIVEEDPYMSASSAVAETPVPNWNVKPASCDPIAVWGGEHSVIPPGCNGLLNLLAAAHWSEFVEVGEELLQTHLDQASLDASITAWSTQIEAAVAEDPHLSAASWQPAVERLRSTVAQSIEDFEGHLAAGYIEE